MLARVHDMKLDRETDWMVWVNDGATWLLSERGGLQRASYIGLHEKPEILDFCRLHKIAFYVMDREGDLPIRGRPHSARKRV